MDTEIGQIYEIPFDFSGGQWQKIAFLRMLNNKRCIMILDEPFSNMDLSSEYELMNYLFEDIFGETAMILISHNTRNVERFDKIIVFSDGKIVEEGDFEQLMKLKGTFYECYVADREEVMLKNQ